MMRILVCGSREWNDPCAIRQKLASYPLGSIVIHGGCRGADVIAGNIAKELGLQVITYPADWKKWGRVAGPKRNQQMLDEGSPDLVLAFHQNISESRGTSDMVHRANQKGVPVEIIAG